MHPTITTDTNNAGASSGSRARRARRARRAASALAALGAIATAVFSLTAVPALADDCPNAVLRAQNHSTQLPDCRAYEQVSPVFKEALPPAPVGIVDDGRLAYVSSGNFAENGNGLGAVPGGNLYLGTRTGSGWSTKALSPPSPDYQTEVASARSQGFSNDLRSTLWTMRRGDEPDTVLDLYVRRGDAFDRIGPLARANTVLASDDLSHVAFLGQSDVYEYIGDRSGEPRMVSVDNAGQSIVQGCSSLLGGRQSTYHAISAGGNAIFWTPECGESVVYARVGGATTIDASASQCMRGPSDPGGACNVASSAEFQGANANGTRVYFTTDQQLVNGDTDETTDLYECDIPSNTPAPDGAVNPCPDLRQVSGAATGADVQGVTRISDDGSRAYFVATGVLAPNPGANDAPAIAGDANLYVWQRDAANPDGETRFVATLAPQDQDPGLSAISGGLWGMDYLGRFAQATDDGRYLVFASYAQLIDSGPQADTDAAKDIYRFDAETGTLTRLSTDVDGQGGNEPGQAAQFTPINYDPGSITNRPPRLAMSNDGGSVVFTTSEALAPSDTNGTTDTYLWHEGRVSLISTGKPSLDGQLPDVDGAPFGTSTRVLALISPSGRDVYFATTARLLSSDLDTVLDIYDARVDGGFAPTPTPTPCPGDACQGWPSAPPSAPAPDSRSSTGQDSAPQTTPTFSVQALTTAQRERAASTGKVVLSVTTNAPGTLTAQATSTIAKRFSHVGSAKRTVTKAGTVTLSLTLAKAARAELKTARKLTVRVLVRQNNVAIARTVSLKLIQPKTAKRKFSGATSRRAAAKGGRS